MKRDVRLQGLSGDHHQALVLARRIERACERGEANRALVNAVAKRFAEELEPHFLVEEEVLLPALAAKGLGVLETKTRGEHAALRGHLEAAKQGDLERLEAFGRILEEHVRFEERELFPACEEFLDDRTLVEVARRAPKKNPKAGGKKA